jgi:hypothetical protein
VDEISRLFYVHKNTVRMWIKVGLPIVDDRRPTLVYGADLRAFLERRRNKSRQRCRPGEIYCVCCRSPKFPAGAMADYLKITSVSGNLRGICPDCEHFMHRRVALARLREVAAGLDVSFPQGRPRI